MCIIIIILDSLFGSTSLCILKSDKRSPEKQVKGWEKIKNGKRYKLHSILHKESPDTLKVIRFFF